jgi:hypothetical protein
MFRLPIFWDLGVVISRQGERLWRNCFGDKLTSRMLSDYRPGQFPGFVPKGRFPRPVSIDDRSSKGKSRARLYGPHANPTRSLQKGLTELMPAATMSNGSRWQSTERLSTMTRGR